MTHTFSVHAQDDKGVGYPGPANAKKGTYLKAHQKSRENA
jgi:hypothetical protein